MSNEEAFDYNTRLAVELRKRHELNKIKMLEYQKQYDQVFSHIKEKYPDNAITDDKLLKQGITEIFPFLCNKCDIYKVFPYDFLTKQNRDTGKGNCSSCMAGTTAIMKKHIDDKSVICPCGVKYYASELGSIKHLNSKTHFNNMEKLVKGKKYTEKELFHLCSINKIPYYKKLNMKEMANLLNKLGDDLVLA